MPAFAPVSWNVAGQFLRRPPLQAFYIALAFFALAVLFSPLPPRVSYDDVLEEPPIAYLEESRGEALLSPPLEQVAQEAETALPFAVEDSGAADAGEEAAAVAATAPAPAPPPAPSWLEYRVRRGDTMERVLRAINVDEEMREYLLRQKMKSYRRLRIKSVVYFQQGADGRVEKILYKTSPAYYFSAGRNAQGALWAQEQPPVVHTERRSQGGVIDSSLYAATSAAGMSDATSDKLVQVLETQIDFYRDVRKGDSFRAVYEISRDEQGDVISAGEILAFEYDSKLEARPRRIRGVYYAAGDISGYYTPEGESLQRAFLPAPLKYRRISSRFSPRRLHPVLKKWRAHRGVDYAAPSGTPVYSTADGVVSQVARQRGYGRVVFIEHFGRYTTVYAHLRAFKKGIRRGTRVKQGQVIGYVGQSGLATGPHLHYEFRVNGKHRDPLSAVTPKQLPPLQGAALQAFQQYSAPLFAEMEAIALSASD